MGKKELEGVKTILSKVFAVEESKKKKKNGVITGEKSEVKKVYLRLQINNL